MVERIVIQADPAPAVKPEDVADPNAAVSEGAVTDTASEETPAQEATETPAETPAETPEETQEEEEAREQIEAAGIDYDALQDEATETGTLSDENFAKLEKIGFPKAVVEEFIAYRMQQAESIRNDVLGVVGGEEAFATKAEWARSNLSEADINEFNAAMESRDMARMKNAMSALETAYTKANGKQPKLLQATSVKPAVGTAYRSMAEFLRDQANPLYKNDPAFRADVEAKLARSKI